MAIGVHTLVDAAAGSQETQIIINLMAQASPIVSDSLWVQANNKLSHRWKVINGLPEAVFRQLYRGVPPSRATYAMVEETCGLLESVSRLDVAELDGIKDKAGYRLQEAAAHIQAIGQKLDTHFFYGSETNDPASFTGLAPRYGSLTGPLGDQIIDAGGTGTTNTSIWLVTWGNRTLHMFYPEGVGTAGIEHIAKDDVELTDASGNLYRAMIDRFIMRPGLAVIDPRFHVRIANIDVTTLGTASGPDLLRLMSDALWKLPTTGMRQTNINELDDKETREFVGGKPVFYVNRTVAAELQRLAMDKSNVHLTYSESRDGPLPVATFMGVPIHVSDSLLNTETRVT